MKKLIVILTAPVSSSWHMEISLVLDAMKPRKAKIKNTIRGAAFFICNTSINVYEKIPGNFPWDRKKGINKSHK